MLIRSQNREALINFNSVAGIEVAEGPVKNSYNIIHHRMQLSARRILG